MNDELILVLNTINDLNEGKEIIKQLLEKKLIACGSILPLGESQYIWKEKLCCEQEYQLILKTLSSHWDALQTELKKLHPYDCPEIISIKAEDVSSDYLHWVKSTL